MLRKHVKAKKNVHVFERLVWNKKNEVDELKQKNF